MNLFENLYIFQQFWHILSTGISHIWWVQRCLGSVQSRLPLSLHFALAAHTTGVPAWQSRVGFPKIRTLIDVKEARWSKYTKNLRADKRQELFTFCFYLDCCLRMKSVFIDCWREKSIELNQCVVLFFYVILIKRIIL